MLKMSRRIVSFSVATLAALLFLFATKAQSWPAKLPVNLTSVEKTVRNISLDGINESDSSPKSGHFMFRLVSNIFTLLNLKQVIRDIEESRSTEGSCYACKFGIALAQHFIESGKSSDEIAKMAYKICTTLRIEDKNVCHGIVNVYKDEFVTVLAQVVLGPDEICGILLGPVCAEVYNPWHNWTIPLTPYPKPPPLPPQPTRRYHGPVSKILHLSDTHIDLKYSFKGDADCGEPLCCRKTTKAIPSQRQSGYWGDYRNCDVPLRTLQAMLKEINRNHRDIDYVIWTGDIPPHDVWSQDRTGQLALIREVSNTINQYLGNIPIYPALGNHESVPVNSFPPPNIKGDHSISWLYDTLAEVWGQWLPKETLRTIKKGGYYSVMIKSDLKLISLNMNYCNNQNWWLLLNSTDPADELSWLIRELQMSEILKHKVHIIGHIPPGSNDCLSVWSRNYNRIVNRYESTITGQFFGHTHQDEFLMFYDDADIESLDKPFADLRPVNVAYIGPSVTTFGGVNPGYRIYLMSDNHTRERGFDDENWKYQVVDHQTYFLNLTMANSKASNETLDWQESYKPGKAYGMINLDPISWHRLVSAMSDDDDLFQTFYSNFFVQSDYIKNRACDPICKADLLCRMITARSHDPAVCERFLLTVS